MMMTVDEGGDYSSSWSREQDKAFENALAIYPEDASDRWEKIAAAVPGKTLEEVTYHYHLLVFDVCQIESGRIPLPSYDDSSLDGSTSRVVNHNGEANHGSKGSKSDKECRKGIAWTEDEHRLFLIGLKLFKKGDWRSIAREVVKTRTPTQVASHAQKYFLRLNSMNKDRRRSSIHDITNVDCEDVTAALGPIMGQSNSSGGSFYGESSKQSPQPLSVVPPGVGMYGAPAIEFFIPANIGMPVNVPPAPEHIGYGVGPQVSRTLVNQGPMNMGPMVYPLQHPSAHT